MAICCTEGLVPVRKLGVAGFLLFLNIFLPGFGTIFSGCCAKKEEKDKEEELEKLKEN